MSTQGPAVDIRRPSDLSDAHIDELRRSVPDEPQATPKGTLPCAWCGCATPVDPNTEEIVAVAFKKAGAFTSPERHSPSLESRFGTCGDCAARAAVARAIARKFPSLTARLGPAGAAHKLESALAGLTVLGRDVPDAATVPGHVVGSLVHRLAPVGGDTAWCGEFAPVMLRPSGTCAARPWSGVSMTTRGRLKVAYAAHLRDRASAARPVQAIKPPAPSRACVLCGVGSVRRSAQDVAALGGVEDARRVLWEPVTTQELTGHLCPSCAGAVASVGSVGPTAMGRACAAYLREAGRGVDADRLVASEVTLAAWGAVSASLVRRGHPPLEPNQESWQHVKLEFP